MKLSRSEPRSEHSIPLPREIYEHLGRHVIGQEQARRVLALAAYSHLRRAEAKRRGYAGPLRKSNVLMIGPTGTGKTLLARHLAEVMHAPFSVADATEYTEAGYYGKDVELMVTDLYLRAERSVEDTQRGVVFIDEVDKIARRAQGGQNGAGARDIGGEGVQQALLKILEGREVTVPSTQTQPWGKHDSVQIDTTNILFVCAGTFSDLHAQRRSTHPIGFGKGQTKPKEPRRTQSKELISFGLLAEFVGRVPVMVELEELDASDLVRVLTEPDDSLVKEYSDRLALDGVDLVLRPAALREIARQAVSRGVGARGLRAIMEEVCSEILFDAPSHPGRKIVIDASYVRGRLSNASGCTA